jgi:hypothetical protein
VKAIGTVAEVDALDGKFPSGAFVFQVENCLKKFDPQDMVYYAGLTMLFVGLALVVSVGTALSVVGAVLTGVSLVNSYVRILLSRSDHAVETK